MIWVIYITNLWWLFAVRGLEELQDPWMLVGTHKHDQQVVCERVDQAWRVFFSLPTLPLKYFFSRAIISIGQVNSDISIFHISFISNLGVGDCGPLFILLDFALHHWCFLLNCNIDPVAAGFICGCCGSCRAKAKLVCWVIFLYLSYFMTLSFHICSSFP